MSDIISAASLIFTIIALTFNSQVKEINYIIEEKEYDRTSPESRKTQKNIVVRAILLKAFPLFLAFWILFYTLLPKAITLIKESSISLWHLRRLKHEIPASSQYNQRYHNQANHQCKFGGFSFR